MIRLDLPNYRKVQEKGYGGGVYYGFHTMAMKLGEALERGGVVNDEDSPVRFCVPFWEEDAEEKERWCFTMWEFPEVAPDLVETCNKYDFVVVPSECQVQWFKNSGVTKPVLSCPLGVDHDFVYKKRSWSKLGLTPFRFLWCGVFTQRKMPSHAVLAFKQAFGNDQDVEFYIKTSKRKYRLAEYLIGKSGNILVDKRRFERDALRELYYTAHCFLHTSPVEGWGLPPAEAMATGALVIAPDYGTLGEFINEKTALVMDTSPHKMAISWWDKEGGISRTYMGTTVRPNLDRLVERLRWIVNNYTETEELRLNGSRQMHDRLTWDHSAKRVIQLIKTHSRRLKDVQKDDSVRGLTEQGDIRCAI